MVVVEKCDEAAGEERKREPINFHANRVTTDIASADRQTKSLPKVRYGPYTRAGCIVSYALATGL